MPYVRICGDVDLSDSLGLEIAAQRLIAANVDLVYVDLGSITFMGSTLVGFLVHVAESGCARRRLVLCRPTPMARLVIGISGVAEVASVRSDLPSWPDDVSVADGELVGTHPYQRA